MPRAYKDNQLVDVFYSSRTTQVKGLGRVENYISKERKYSVRMLSYNNYYVPSHYHRSRGNWQPHDKVLKAWSYELTPCYDMKPHIDEMERTRSDTIQAMYNDVAARVKNSDKPVIFGELDGVNSCSVNNYFSSNADDWKDWRDGNGNTMLHHVAYISFCLQRLQASSKTENYVSTYYFERSDYNVWRY